jgi:hypothetical protein
MTVGFAILAHDDPKQLQRLLKVLTGYPVALHLDASVNKYDYLDSMITDENNFFFVEKRFHVNWGGFSMVQAMISAADSVATQLTANDHIVFLSGHCFPIKPISELDLYLAQTTWKQHILAFDSELAGKFSERRWRKRYWFDLNIFSKNNSKIRKIIRKLIFLCTFFYRVHPPKNIRTAIGSQWICITKECYSDIREKVIGEELHYLRNSFAPDEMVFHTAVYNSVWREETQYKKLHHNYDENISIFSNLHIIDPDLSGDFTALSSEDVKGKHFFTRKISSLNFDLFRTGIGSYFKEEFLND